MNANGRLSAGLLLVAFILWSAVAPAQPVNQNGPITSGHAASWTSPGVIQDAGPATSGLITELGVTKRGGCAIGVNSGPLSGPFNELCFGVDGTQGYLSLNSFGGNPPTGFNFIINGVTFPLNMVSGATLGPNTFTGNQTINGLILGSVIGTSGHTLGYLDQPLTFSGSDVFGNITVNGSLTLPGLSASLPVCTDVQNRLSTIACTSGSGTVIGPPTSTNNDIVVFNGGTGALIKDSGVGIGTSGAAVPLLSTANTWTLAQTAPSWVSTVATGAAPLTVTSTTVVTHLNASLLSGSAIGTSGAAIPLLSTANTWTLAQSAPSWTSTVSTGTAPLTVASTTAVANLNASLLSGSAVGTSGATIGLNNGNNTLSGADVLSGTLQFNALTASAPICTNGSKVAVTCGSAVINTIKVVATSNATVGTLPANAFILWSTENETAGHNVTVTLGTTSGASDVTVTPFTLSANKGTVTPVTSYTLNWFSLASTQTIFISSSSWNSASVNISIFYVVP